jgi:hypothetical protein
MTETELPEHTSHASESNRFGVATTRGKPWLRRWRWDCPRGMP